MSNILSGQLPTRTIPHHNSIDLLHWRHHAAMLGGRSHCLVHDAGTSLTAALRAILYPPIEGAMRWWCHMHMTVYLFWWVVFLVGIDPAELPTSTFLPYFVRFLKENTAVCFYLIKCFFEISLFFFFLLESESSEIYTHYLCYEKLVRVFE